MKTSPVPGTPDRVDTPWVTNGFNNQRQKDSPIVTDLSSFHYSPHLHLEPCSEDEIANITYFSGPLAYLVRLIRR